MRFLICALALAVVWGISNPAQAQFAKGFAEAIRESEERAFQREMLQLQLEHQRQMQQAPAPSGVEDFLIYRDIDFLGGDLIESGVRGLSFEGCVQLCQNLGECRAVSWVANMNWCWPKNGEFHRQLNEGIISAIRD